MKRPILVASLLLASLPLMSGCIAAIRSTPPTRASATLGQQLIDLQKARDSGAISESEYQMKRAKFLNGS